MKFPCIGGLTEGCGILDAANVSNRGLLAAGWAKATPPSQRRGVVSLIRGPRQQGLPARSTVDPRREHGCRMRRPTCGTAAYSGGYAFRFRGGLGRRKRRKALQFLG